MADNPFEAPESDNVLFDDGPPLASLGARFLGALIDTGLIFGAFLVPGMLMMFLLGGPEALQSFARVVVAFFLVLL